MPKSKTRQSTPKRPEKVPLTYYRSASGHRGESKSPFVRDKPRDRIKRVLFGALDLGILVLLLIFFGYSLILNTEPAISATSYIYRSADSYQLEVKKQLRSFSNRNKLTINEGQIVRNLQTVFPEISGANLELPIISQTPKIHLTISEPAFVLNNASMSYIVSKSGIVIGQSTSFRGLDGLPEVSDEANFKLEKGSPALSAASSKFIDYVWRHTQKAKIPVASLVLPPLPMELNLRTSDKPYFVKFYLGGDAALQTGQFLATRQQFEREGTNPANYLDVRVQGKIFYR